MTDNMVYTAPESKLGESEFFESCMRVFLKDLTENERDLLTAISARRSLKQISEDLDKPYSTVKSQATRSKEKIRRNFIACCNIKSIAIEPEKIKDNCESC